MHAERSQVADENSQPEAHQSTGSAIVTTEVQDQMMARLKLDDVQQKEKPNAEVQAQEASPNVDGSLTTSPSAKPVGHKVFADGFPPFIEDTEFKEHILSCGVPLSLEIIPPSDHKSVNWGHNRWELCSCAFIEYATADEADCCIKFLRSDGFHAELARDLSQPFCTFLDIEDVKVYMLKKKIRGERPGQPPAYARLWPEQLPDYALPNTDGYHVSQLVGGDGGKILARLEFDETDRGGHAPTGGDSGEDAVTPGRPFSSELWVPRFTTERIHPGHPEEGEYTKIISADGRSQFDLLLPPEFIAALKARHICSGSTDVLNMGQS